MQRSKVPVIYGCEQVGEKHGWHRRGRVLWVPAAKLVSSAVRCGIWTATSGTGCTLHTDQPTNENHY